MKFVRHQSLLALLIATVANGEPTTMPAGASIEQISARLFELGGGDTAQREAARQSLLALRREQLPLLRNAVVASGKLAPGTWAELHDIVVHVYLTGEPYESEPTKGFLGVQMTQDGLIFEPEKSDLPPVVEPFPPDAAMQGMRSGIIITECVPGFCAYGVLVAGDVILAIPELHRATFSSNRDLGDAIKATAPGQRVTLRVLRRGHEIDVPIVLDARPVVADEARGQEFNALEEDRRKRAEDYWQTTFAPLAGEELL